MSTFLNFRLEDAVKTYLDQAGVGGLATIYRTADALAAGDEIALPYVAVVVANGRPAFPECDARSAVWNRALSCAVVCRSYAEDEATAGETRAAHEALVGACLDALTTETVASDVNAVASGVAIDQMDFPEDSTTTEARSYQTTLAWSATVHPVAVVD